MKDEVKWIMNYLDERELIPEMDKCINLIMLWSQHDHGYESKNARIAEWNPSEKDVYAVLCHILIGCFIHGQMTYQAMIGFICNDIKCLDQLDRIKTAAEVIAMAYQHDLITITKTRDTMYVSTAFELDETLPDFEHHCPESKPYVANTNQILGCRFKQHDEDVCMSHINKMNRVGFTLNWSVLDTLKESTDSEDVQFVARSLHMYEHLVDQTFYLKHNYDTRGRTYCEGYYVNYQGSQYKKAIVQLAKKELI